MESFEFDALKGLYKINEEIIIKKIYNKYQIYLVDYLLFNIYKYEIDNLDFNEVEEISDYEDSLYEALKLECNCIYGFNNKEELSEYLKINVLDEFSESDFVEEKVYNTIKFRTRLLAFIKFCISDFFKFVCVITIISIFSYLISNKSLFMLNSIYGNSMKPTLKTYSAGVVVYPYHISHGDLVACRLEVDGEKINILKRVIALPGDRVEIKNDYIYVNGELIDEPYIKNGYRTNYLENLKWENIWRKTAENHELTYDTNNIPLTIPANYYFVLGDNRRDSYDSRDFGLIHFDEIVGEYVFTLITI